MSMANGKRRKEMQSRKSSEKHLHNALTISPDFVATRSNQLILRSLQYEDGLTESAGRFVCVQFRDLPTEDCSPGFYWNVLAVTSWSRPSSRAAG